MVKLRLARAGKKKKPIYKIVAADARAPRDGKFIESIGQYDPNMNPMIIDVKETALFRWLKNGAQPTDTVRSLLRRKGLWLKWALVKRGSDETFITTKMDEWNRIQVDKAVRESAKKERRKVAKKKAAQETAAA
ncbi:MAG: 30S ribosomal protein S16 [Bacteroidota bacterium]